MSNIGKMVIDEMLLKTKNDYFLLCIGRKMDLWENIYIPDSLSFQIIQKITNLFYNLVFFIIIFLKYFYLNFL